MSPPDRHDPDEHVFADDEPHGPAQVVRPQHYGRYVGLLAVVILILILINTIVTKPNGSAGVPPGAAMPPFAVPLALAELQGAADVATHPNEGNAGRVPACKLRGPQIFNICQLYERSPVVLALFVNGSSCTGVLGKMQALAPHFPGVDFAAVALRGSRSSLRKLVHKSGFSFPVGYDEEGTLAALYQVASCPQVTFGLPGGTVQSRALVEDPSTATFRRRVEALVAASVARGWREPRS